MDESGTKPQDGKTLTTPSGTIVPEPKVGEIIHEGKVYTAKELAGLLAAEHNYAVGFTHKTQALSKKEGDVEEERKVVRQEKAKVAELVAAFQRDVATYRRLDPSDEVTFKGFHPESLTMAKDLGIDVNVEPGSSKMVQELQAVKDGIAALGEKLERKTSVGSAEASLDAVIAIGRELQKQYPLADHAAIVDKVRLHIYENGDPPGKELMEGWTRDSQARMTRLGVRIVEPKVILEEKKPVTPPVARIGAPPPPSSDHPPPGLFDLKAMKEAQIRFRESRRAVSG